MYDAYNFSSAFCVCFSSCSASPAFCNTHARSLVWFLCGVSQAWISTLSTIAPRRLGGLVHRDPCWICGRPSSFCSARLGDMPPLPVSTQEISVVQKEALKGADLLWFQDLASRTLTILFCPRQVFPTKANSWMTKMASFPGFSSFSSLSLPPGSSAMWK